MRVLAIDPGLRNLAYCVLDDGGVFDIANTDLFCGEAIDARYVCDKILQWCEGHKHYFDTADAVVCERQFLDHKFHLSSVSS